MAQKNYRKPNSTKQIFINKPKNNITQNICETLKPGLVTLYSSWPEDRSGLFLHPQGQHMACYITATA